MDLYEYDLASGKSERLWEASGKLSLGVGQPRSPALHHRRDSSPTSTPTSTSSSAAQKGKPRAADAAQGRGRSTTPASCRATARRSTTRPNERPRVHRALRDGSGDRTRRSRSRSPSWDVEERRLLARLEVLLLRASTPTGSCSSTVEDAQTQQAGDAAGAARRAARGCRSARRRPIATSACACRATARRRRRT